MPTAHIVSASSSLAVSQACVLNQVKPLSAQSQLEFSQQLGTNIKIERTSSALSFNSDTGSSAILNYWGLSELNVTDLLSYSVRQIQNTSSVLSITSSARSNIIGVRASSDLTIVDTLRYAAPIYVTAENRINLMENYDDIADYYALYGVTDISQLNDVELRNRMVEENAIRVNASVNMIYNLAVASLLNIGSEGRLPIFAVASNHLHLSDSSARTPYGSGLSELHITQLLSGGASKSSWDYLALRAIATYNIVKTLVPTSSLTLTTFASSYLEQYCLNPVVPSAPVRVRRDSVVFSYPYASPTVSVTLKTPELGNSINIESLRINRRTRGNTLVIARDPVWPKSNKYSVTFSDVAVSKFWEMFELIRQSLGKPVKYLDYNSIEHQVIIITPNVDFNESHQELFSFTLQLEEVT